MITFKINDNPDLDMVGVRANKDWNEIYFFYGSRLIHKERYYRVIFNTYHFIDDMNELGIEDRIVKDILNFYKTYGKVKS